MKEILDVQPLEDYKLLLTFSDKEKKIKDMKPYLDKGVFVKLKNKKFFNSVRVAYGTISWNGEIDICADTLYQTSEVYKDKTKEISK